MNVVTPLLLQTLMSAYKAHQGVAMTVLTQWDLTGAPVPEDMRCLAMEEHVQVGTWLQKESLVLGLHEVQSVAIHQSIVYSIKHYNLAILIQSVLYWHIFYVSYFSLNRCQ